ncbi:DMT family transporter [Insolitispirillum peregrinum]|uniref:Threonine/homoserine efflux transporter RhtA n=1 Tax=Insolitispirillum peregrinum TaxID=80876 RepID=A0A1N7MYT5_9PROT|nr:DMT family transporter [Insolitispirillum peregrinum]SIS91283.1 Threonine/homoserine efflux transporter RhtA [Insolitispirillum peregrinum]
MRLLLLIATALLAFAGNSLLCRVALRDTALDPVSFVALRLGSGAAILWLIVSLQRRGGASGALLAGSWKAAIALFVYALAFALAYLTIPAGTGALLLFASIQISMILYGLIIGERLSGVQWVGLACAVGGLVVLMLPKLGAPPLTSATLMVMSGIAWGAYSLLGRGTTDPIAATAGNFVRATPCALLVLAGVAVTNGVSADWTGVGYAVVSGAITSGLGYVLWYAALRHLTVTRAATLQLSVPLLATLGGAMFLGEPFTLLLGISALAIVSGIGLVVAGKKATP